MTSKTVTNRQFQRPFAEAFKATRILEMAENYSIADLTQVSKFNRLAPKVLNVTSEKQFWEDRLTNAKENDAADINIPNCTISKWVPRVPGLYWTKESAAIRKLADNQVESVNGGWIHLTPHGKTARVMGGVGTNMFAPDEKGNHLVCLSIDGNASLGIPALITAEVWEAHRLRDGYEVKIQRGRWELMAQQWLSFFIAQSVSRSYLIINDPRQLTVSYKSNPTYVFHPYTIMEYSSGNAVFYDYVFCNAEIINGSDFYRTGTKRFFESYRTDKGRNGRYLLASDIEEPLFEADYLSPADLRRNEIAGKTHMDILKEKIKGQYFKGKLLEEIIISISEFYSDDDDIKRLATYAHVPKTLITGKTTADKVAELVNQCVQKGNLDNLIDKIAVEQPQILF